MKHTKLILVTAICLLINSFAFSQVSEKRLDSLKTEMRKFIEKELKKSKTVGLSIAIVDNQDVVWSEGFGFSDLQNKVKATNKTIYRIGSTTKLFTAMGVMQLVESGKIDLDAPIQTYIPELKIKSRFEKPGIITTRNLLTHHSGLPCEFVYNFYTPNLEPISTLIERLNETYTCAQPNTVWAYSNIGYTILGILIEKVSGENYNDYIQKHLLEPMQMNNSGITLSAEMKKMYSKAYVNQKEFDEQPIFLSPAGLLHSSVLDMANFMKTTFNNGSFNDVQVLKAETLKEMQTKQNTNCALDFNFNIGLCWWLNSPRWNYAGEYAEHFGDTHHFHCCFSELLTHKIGVVVLANSEEGIAVVRKVSAELLKKYLELKKGIKAPTEPSFEVKKMNIPAEKLNSYCGFYNNLNGNLLEVKVESNKLVAQIDNKKIKLLPNDENTFVAKTKTMGVIPVTIGQMRFTTINGVKYISMKSKPNRLETAMYIETSKPVITDVWEKRMGRYACINDTSKHSFVYKQVGEIKIKNDFLVFDIGGLIYSLKLINDNEAIVDGIGRDTGHSVLFKDDEFMISGLVFKKMEEKK